MSTSEQITVVGAGLMGHGIAQLFAVRGHTVWLVDVNDDLLSSAKEQVGFNLRNMRTRGLTLTPTSARSSTISTPRLSWPCLRGQCFVFEAVFEDLELKQRLFAKLDTLCPPETILCSNTSVISITEIAMKARHRERIVGTHFWNPPYLIPLVEVVQGRRICRLVFIRHI